MELPQLIEAGRERPVYRQIAEQIRAQIRSGEMTEGERLPPIRTLARVLRVNRDTVALAYDALSAEGLLQSVVGRGTFVRGGIRSPRSSEPLRIPLSSRVEGLLAFEGARPRYGEAKDLVALHSLIPDPALYPFEAFRRCLNRVLARSGPELFLYGSSQGHAGLRGVLAERFGRVGIEISPADLVLCHGSSQGIAMAVRLFAEPGDAVAVEVPTYHNVLATLVALGVEAVPVPMRKEGVDLEALEHVLCRPEVKAFYTIPSFHNPMGITTGIDHRRRLLALAARCEKPVLEDAFEMDLHHSSRPLAPLAGLDQHELVVHLYSFSKSLFPGVRVGCIAARGRAVEGLLALKRASDLSDSQLLQAALEEFLRSGGYDRHLARIRRILRERRHVLLSALEAEMPPGASWTEPEGGYQLWVELPFEVDTRDLLADAARAGVLFAPGSNFLHDRRASRGLRLTVAQAGESEIRRGVAALGRVIRDRLQAEPGAREAARVHL